MAMTKIKILLLQKNLLISFRFFKENSRYFFLSLLQHILTNVISRMTSHIELSSVIFQEWQNCIEMRLLLKMLFVRHQTIINIETMMGRECTQWTTIKYGKKLLHTKSWKFIKFSFAFIFFCIVYNNNDLQKNFPRDNCFRINVEYHCTHQGGRNNLAKRKKQQK